MRWLAGFLFALCLAPAAELKDFSGTWAMKLGQRNLYVLTLTQDGQALRGTMDRPTRLSGHNSIFEGMSGGVRRDIVVKSSLVDSILHFTIQNANDPKDEDDYTLAVLSDHADMRIDRHVRLTHRASRKFPDEAIPCAPL